MRLHVVAVGRLKSGPEQELADRFAKRAEQAGRPLGFRGLAITELREGTAADAAQRMADEAQALRAALPAGATIIVLDERGKTLGSTAFADMLARRRDAGTADCVFIIGGADGLDPALRDSATEKIAFGAATWPHQLVRIMLLEQIYRAMTILSGHPYHRA